MNFSEIEQYIRPDYKDKVEVWIRNELMLILTPIKKRPACPFHGKKYIKWEGSWYCGLIGEDGVICGFHPIKGRSRKPNYRMREGRIPNDVKIKIYELGVSKETLIVGVAPTILSAFINRKKKEGRLYKRRVVPEGVIIKRLK